MTEPEPARASGRPLWVAVSMLPALTVAGLGVGAAADWFCACSPVLTAVFGICAPIGGLIDIIRKGIR